MWWVGAVLITGGALHDVPDPSAQVTGPAACDSRQVRPGGMFAALPGARADGHDFAAQAHAAGAVCVLASRPVGWYQPNWSLIASTSMSPRPLSSSSLA
jgi:UDP-N-acetylmuramyl pentapeptide synthase